MLMTCEKPSSNTLYWIFNMRNIAYFWKCRKWSILRTYMRKIKQDFPYPYVTEWFIKLYYIYIHYLEYRKSCKSIFTFKFRKWLFLAHLSRRLKWAIVIAHRPSSVRPWTFHIFDFFSRTAWWILMKLGRDEVVMVPYKCCCFSARSAQGRIQGRANIGHGGSPSLRNFFFKPEGYSNKLNA